MAISYVAKHLIRSWQLYIALLLGVVLAATFFAGVNIGADTVAKQALDQALDQIPADFIIRTYAAMSTQNITTLINKIATVENIAQAEAISRTHLSFRTPEQQYVQWCTLAGITQNSRVYNGWTNPPAVINENQTYIPTESSIAKTLKQGDTIQANISQSVYNPEFGNATFITYPLNLTVAGARANVARHGDRILRIEDGTIKAALTPAQILESATAISYVDQLKSRLADIDKQLEQLDKDFRANKIDGDQFAEQRQRLKQAKTGLLDELHRMGVVI